MSLRYYTLALRAAGTEEQEFTSDQARQLYLDKQDSTFDDWFCLDVNAVGGINFYIAQTGEGENK
jgi:hypothetical protein